MNAQPTNKVSWYKLSFISTGFILLLNGIGYLIATNFSGKNISIMFGWEYPVFSIGLEGVCIFLCIAGTYLITSKLTDFNFKTVLIRLILFSSFYLIFSLIASFIMYLILSGDPNKFFKLNFKYFISGMRYSFVFMLIWIVLKYRQKKE